MKRHQIASSEKYQKAFQTYTTDIEEPNKRQDNDKKQGKSDKTDSLGRIINKQIYSN
ncbi:hypothetical protein BACOVA_01533 [Bacteroides ovatus ATCC 8483]|jgi:hypothetical protein|uniref:Uncharacterized protein n=1 Tax=Bacteroides ovatus (strain ATCC 8483 / DSM 1896 / JCM 5824 / BCRC 10623 / CCUG 4943 / NCTC 11153) TaxID=411476 RepID=A0AAN3A9Z6_BACO1|nr:hypothetical protein BACOVA_01533 [Bacteroides ovatus ATCC 8483]